MKNPKVKFIRSIELNKTKDFEEGLNTLKRFDFKDRYGYTTLHIASELNRLDFIKKLLEKGVHPDIKNKNKNTTLLSVVDSIKKSDAKKEEVIELLLQHGANPNYKKSKQSYSILHRAVMNYNISAMKLLLQYGANPSENLNVTKFTPLFFAYNLESLNLLLDYKATVNIHDKHNNLPMIYHILISN